MKWVFAQPKTGAHKWRSKRVLQSKDSTNEVDHYPERPGYILVKSTHSFSDGELNSKLPTDYVVFLLILAAVNIVNIFFIVSAHRFSQKTSNLFCLLRILRLKISSHQTADVTQSGYSYSQPTYTLPVRYANLCTLSWWFGSSTEPVSQYEHSGL